MVQYNQKVREEFDRWNRPFAPSVVYAKSLRAEDPPASGAGKTASGTDDDPGQQQQQEEDPLAGIDLDNLPEDVREKLTKFKGNIASLQKTSADALKKTETLEKAARTNQSRADQYAALLRKHNLLEDPNQRQQQQDPEAQILQELTADFVKEGLDPATAAAYAKMQVKAHARLRTGLLEEVGKAVGPTMGQVGAMQVDRMLTAATNDDRFYEPLSQPEVFEGAREILLTMVQQGQRVDQPTLETAIKIAIGEFAMKPNQTQQQQQQAPPQRQQFQQNRQVTGGTRFSGFAGAAPNPRRETTGAPIPANAETARAGAKVAEAMKRSLKPQNQTTK